LKVLDCLENIGLLSRSRFPARTKLPPLCCPYWENKGSEARSAAPGSLQFLCAPHQHHQHSAILEPPKGTGIGFFFKQRSNYLQILSVSKTADICGIRDD